MLKKALAFLIIILLGTDLIAQQEQTYSQYMFVPSIYNPGHTGSKNAICATGIMKQQWVGLEGAPTVYAIMVESPVKMLRGGIGININTDQIAGFNNTSVKLKYAYHRKRGDNLLGIGIGVGLLNQRLDFSYFNVSGEDPLLTSTEEESGMIFDIDFGLYYHHGKKWYAGVSSTQIIQGSMKISGGETQLRRGYYATAGYYFRFLRMPKIVVSPSFFVGYTESAPLLINIGAIGEYNNMFWGGVLYKHQEGIAVMAGVEYKNIKVGYAYDINTNQLKNGGSHEIRLGYCFKLEIDKPKRSYKNTRYL